MTSRLIHFQEKAILTKGSAQIPANHCPCRKGFGQTVKEFALPQVIGMLTGLFVERLADLVIPSDVVPALHLIAEKAREEEHLRSAELEDLRVRQVPGLQNEMIENLGQIRHAGHGRAVKTGRL